MRSVGEFLACGAVLQNRTYFKSVGLVPGGSVWTFKGGRTKCKAAYFDPANLENQEPLPSSEYDQALASTWKTILPPYFSGPEEVALSLTGGVDSRLILACAPREQGKLKCYTFGGIYRDCADVSVSRRAAKAAGQPHTTIPLESDFFRSFGNLLEKTTYITDGLLDLTGAVDLYMQRRAREIAPVRVTGLNGGELLRSLVMFKPKLLSFPRLCPDLADDMAQAESTYRGESQCHPLSFIMFNQAPWCLAARLAVERSQLSIRTPYFHNQIVQLAYRARPESQTVAPALKIIAGASPEVARVPTDRAVAADSPSLFNSMQRAFQEFTFKAEYAFDYGMPQWLTRVDSWLSPFRFERLFLGRHKFYHFRTWYRHELADYIKRVLLDPVSLARPY